MNGTTDVPRVRRSASVEREHRESPQPYVPAVPQSESVPSGQVCRYFQSHVWRDKLLLISHSNCGTTRTPLWRRSPQGATICNAWVSCTKGPSNASRPTNLKRFRPLDLTLQTKDQDPYTTPPRVLLMWRLIRLLQALVPVEAMQWYWGSRRMQWLPCL